VSIWLKILFFLIFFYDFVILHYHFLKKKRFCGDLQFLSDRFVLVLLLRPEVLQVFLDKGFFLKKNIVLYLTFEDFLFYFL